MGSDLTETVTAIHIQLRDETLADIDEFAEAVVLSRSKVINYACQSYIAQHRIHSTIKQIRALYITPAARNHMKRHDGEDWRVW